MGIMIRVSVKDLKEADKRYVEMFEVLKSIEWIGMPTLTHCPVCHQWRYKQGHKETCRLDKILKAVAEADQTEELKR